MLNAGFTKFFCFLNMFTHADGVVIYPAFDFDRHLMYMMLLKSVYVYSKIILSVELASLHFLCSL